ncbi:hypothetical protein GUJ93_ZPchr0010g10285 [Zizania palustris]|uniref:Uncharacterized protein n=1 Tax=Zizania palustris TaxID=103762 RepID=A0A8J5W7Z3_ZIZPA|nr:hypothetical protein GUJ93_ZPchr0010g10285 [Zizania palustris]
MAVAWSDPRHLCLRLPVLACLLRLPVPPPPPYPHAGRPRRHSSVSASPHRHACSTFISPRWLTTSRCLCLPALAAHASRWPPAPPRLRLPAPPPSVPHHQSSTARSPPPPRGSHLRKGLTGMGLRPSPIDFFRGMRRHEGPDSTDLGEGHEA